MGIAEAVSLLLLGYTGVNGTSDTVSYLNKTCSRLFLMRCQVILIPPMTVTISWEL